MGLEGLAKPCAEITEVFVKGKLTKEAASVLEPGGVSETGVPYTSPGSDTDPESAWGTGSDKESAAESSDSAPSLQDESDNEGSITDSSPDRGGPDGMEPWDIDWDADVFASSEEFVPASAAASASGGDPAGLAAANGDYVPTMPCRRLQRKSKQIIRHRVKNQP